MRIVPVDYLPERTSTDYHKLDEFFKMFMKSNVKYARVEFADREYSTEATCRGSLHSYILRNPDLPIKVHLVSGDVYLIRTDLED